MPTPVQETFLIQLCQLLSDALDRLRFYTF